MQKLLKLQKHFTSQSLLSQATSTFSKDLPKAFNSILIKGGTVVNADHKFRADVVVEGGKIAQVIRPEDGSI